MKGTWKIGLFALAVTLSASIYAQPPRGGQGGGRGNRAAFMVNRMVAIEQVLGFLAFDSKIALSDKQLTQIRKELKGIHAKRTEMAKEMQGSNDPQEARQKVMVLAREMNQKVVGVLDAKQTETYKTYMKRMQERMQRGGRQGGGQRGQRGQRGG